MTSLTDEKKKSDVVVVQDEQHLLKLIGDKVSLKNKTIKGLPPIVYATSLYDEDLACEILNNGVDVDCNVRHDYGYRPLHYACEYGMVKLVTVILKKMKSKFGKNKTQFSNFINNTTTIDLQLQMKSVQGGGKTFLHFAAMASEPQGCEIIKILIDEYNANINVIDWDENTPVVLAAMHNHMNSLNLLLSRMNNSSSNNDSVTDSATQRSKHIYTLEWLTKKRKRDYENGKIRIKKMWSIPKSLKTPYALKKHFSIEECNILLNGVKKYTSKNGWLSDRHRGYATTDVRVDKMPELNKWLINLLQTRLFPVLARKHGFLVDTFKFRDLFFVYYNAGVSKKDTKEGQPCNSSVDNKNKEPQQRSVGIHRDGSIISFNILLNSENDFIGGGTFFEEDNNCIVDNKVENKKLVSMEGVYGKVYTIQRGDVLVHSGKLRHGGYEIISGKRILLVGFVDAGDDPPLDLHFQDH
jgi:hypothetical protein